jgi:hypothetical protein
LSLRVPNKFVLSLLINELEPLAERTKTSRLIQRAEDGSCARGIFFAAPTLLAHAASSLPPLLLARAAPPLPPTRHCFLQLSPLLLAAASSYGFLSRGMAFGPYDPALCGLPNEPPYVSPDLLVVSRSNKNNNYMDSSVCSNSSTGLGSSLALTPSHDSQIELVLYSQKSMRNQLSNVNRLAYLRKLHDHRSSGRRSASAYDLTVMVRLYPLA